MFLQFFGLKDNPFKLTAAGKGLFLGQHHEEALAHLRFAIAEGEGFTVITGQNGVGKSTICRALVESLQGSATVAFLSSPIAGPRELLQRMNRSFGIAADAQSTHGLIDGLNRFLMRERVARRRVVVFIDDAQILAPAVLEQIRLISNLETTREKLIQMVLVGEPALMQLLNSHQLRQMGQRVSVHYDIGPLTIDETAAYIQHRLSVVSTGPPVRFSREAVRKIFRYARGNPRRINIVCSRMLETAFKARMKEMTGELADSVIRVLDQLEGRHATGPVLAGWPIRAMALGGLLLLGAAAFWMFRPAPLRPLPEPTAFGHHDAVASAPEELSLPEPRAVDAAAVVTEPPAAANPAAASPEPRMEPASAVKKTAMTHSVQIGAYLQVENAQQATSRLKAKGYAARIVEIKDAGGRTWHTVRIGDHPSHQAAQAQADEFSRRERQQSVVRPFRGY